MRPIFIAFGKLSFESALITPIMVQLIYSTMPDGVFISFNKVIELGIGNVCCVLLAAMFIYLAFEFPIRRIVEMSLYKHVTHDEIYHLSLVTKK